jgi:Flp pilus assembly pilin Flp
MSHPGTSQMKRAARRRPGWLLDEQGVSTSEYVLLFVIICIGTLFLFTKLGTSVAGVIN